MAQLTENEYDGRFQGTFEITNPTYIRDSEDNIIGIQFETNGETWGCPKDINNNLWQKIQYRVNNHNLIING